MKITFTVEGMNCGHCQKAVTNAAASVTGVASVEVDLKAKTATVSGENFDTEAVKEAIEEQGYDVVGIE